MDKRYQVFVSSTFEDLIEERKIVTQILLESDCIPAGMELFPASNEDQWSLIKDVINDSDYYLLIIGGRYGSTNDEGKSYTQMEYEFAQKLGKPIIAFLHKDPDAIPSGKTEKTAKGKKALKEFKSEVKGFIVKFWETPEELAAQVVVSLNKLIKKFPAEGWAKTNSIVDESSVKEIARLQAENRQLKDKLIELSTQPPEGIEDLAGGEDMFSVQYKTRDTDDKANYVTTINLTWNQIFAAVAPHIINEGSEFDIEQAIKELIVKILRGEKRKCEVYCWIQKESMGIILVQLKALGLIKLSEKKHGIKSDTFWQLTPYGDLTMTRLVALHKDQTNYNS